MEKKKLNEQAQLTSNWQDQLPSSISQQLASSTGSMKLWNCPIDLRRERQCYPCDDFWFRMTDIRKTGNGCQTATPAEQPQKISNNYKRKYKQLKAAKMKSEKSDDANDEIASTINFYYVDKGGHFITALHMAAIKSRFAVMDLLITSGADLNVDGAYLLDLAVKKPNSNYLRLVARSGIDVNVRDPTLFCNDTLLLYLIMRGPPRGRQLDYARKIKWLVRYGASMTTADDFLRTPLHWAVHCANGIALKAMLKEISETELRTVNSVEYHDRVIEPDTPEELRYLQWTIIEKNIFTSAIAIDCLEVIEFAITRLYDDERFEVCDPPFSYCLAHMALIYCSANCFYILKHLLQKGLDCNRCTLPVKELKPHYRGHLDEWIAIARSRNSTFSPRFSLLGYAIGRKSADLLLVIKLLIEYGAAVNPCGIDVIPPIIMAEWIKNDELRLFLKSHGAVERVDLLEMLDSYRRRLSESLE
ncbi:Ankyrin repeat domain-containing protein 44 [Chamberlinius hualienensis]